MFFFSGLRVLLGVFLRDELSSASVTEIRRSFLVGHDLFLCLPGIGRSDLSPAEPQVQVPLMDLMGK